MKRNSNYSKPRFLRKEFLCFIRGKCKHFPACLSQAEPDMEDSVEIHIKKLIDLALTIE